MDFLRIGESMDEILNKLLQSELLSEETKATLSEQWTASIETYKATLREEVSNEVKLQLSEQWLTEREELVTKVEALIESGLTAEIAELKADIERFRDLEAEYAEKIVEEKHSLAAQVSEELDELVEKLDSFFEARLKTELDELKEDLNVVKQNEFGRTIFEAFASTFAKTHVDENAIAAKLEAAQIELEEVQSQLQEAKKAQTAALRESKLERLLANLTGKKREQMEMLLKNVDTDKLDESYKFFIGRILKEDVATKQTISEGVIDDKKTTVVTGDKLVENAEPEVVVDAAIARAKRLAGIK